MIKIDIYARCLGCHKEMALKPQKEIESGGLHLTWCYSCDSYNTYNYDIVKLRISR